jgi:hypothetical protein
MAFVGQAAEPGIAHRKKRNLRARKKRIDGQDEAEENQARYVGGIRHFLLVYGVEHQGKGRAFLYNTSTMMSIPRILLAVICCASIVLAADSIGVFGQKWTVQSATDWVVGENLLQLKTSAEPPAGQPRRPTKFALLESKPYTKVTVDAEVRRNGRSVILVYAWQDDAHYNYAHISVDTAASQNVHNGMFHIFGGERVRMSSLEGPGSLPTQDWTPVKLVFDGEAGKCYVEVNGKRNPSLEAMDLSLRWGRVGLGSFDETGDFRNVKVTGETREPGQFGRP